MPVDKTDNFFIQTAMASGGEPMVSESFISKKKKKRKECIYFFLQKNSHQLTWLKKET